MHGKTKTISGEQVATLKAILAGYRKMRHRVDVVSDNLERFHTRITILILRLLKAGKQV